MSLSNVIIKMAKSKHLANNSIIIVECMALRHGILATKNNGFLNLKIEGNSKVIIDCYNKKK